MYTGISEPFLKSLYKVRPYKVIIFLKEAFIGFIVKLSGGYRGVHYSLCPCCCP